VRPLWWCSGNHRKDARTGWWPPHSGHHIAVRVPFLLKKMSSFIFLRNVLGFEKSFLVCFEKCVSAGGYIWKLVCFTSFEKSFQHFRSEQSFLAVYQTDPYFLPSLIAKIYKTLNSYSLKNLGDTISKKKKWFKFILSFSSYNLQYISTNISSIV